MTEIVAIDRTQYERIATIEEQIRGLIKDNGRLEAHFETQSKILEEIKNTLNGIVHDRNVFSNVFGWGAAVLAAAAGYLLHWWFPLAGPK